jgi:protein-glutamine gamma-glutamyltransferase
MSTTSALGAEHVARALRIDRPVLVVLLIGLGLGTYGIVDFMPLWLWPVLAGFGYWRWRLANQGRPPPPSHLRTAVGLGVAGLLVATGNVGLGLEAAIPLFITFLWLKLLEADNERDLGMTAALGSFLAGASVLIDQSLDQMLLAFISVFLMWTAVLSAHLPPGPKRRRQAARRCFLMCLQGLPIGLILFVFLPRPVVRLNLNQGQARSGLSDHLVPGSISALAVDKRVAFRVTFPETVPSDFGALYWRGIVLSVTDGSGWYRERRSSGLGRPPRQVTSGDDPLIIQNITLLPHGRQWLYALDPPISVDSNATIAPGSELARSEAINTPLTYEVQSRPGREAADGNSFTISSAMAIPEKIDPRVSALAGTWMQETLNRGGGLAIMEQVASEWFLAQGFMYSLEPGTMGADPTATFLFDRKAGFCSHYASAFALLARLQGIPSRVVMGFRGGEWNAPGGFLVVRNAHAHAWCECYDRDTQSWRRIDPTVSVTADRLERMTAEGGAAGDPTVSEPMFGSSTQTLRQWWDYVDASWQTAMLRFDADLQLEVSRSIGLGSFGRGGLLISAGVGAALALAAVALLLRRRQQRPDLAHHLYHRWCRRLPASVGPPAANEAPLAFAQRAVKALPDRSDDIHAVTQAYISARYAAPSEGAIRHLRAAIKRRPS